MRAAILVFARAPEPGRAKTRLIPALGANGAARLQAALIDDTLARARAASPAAVELWGTGDDPDGFLAAVAARHGATLHRQVAGDLGVRMHTALERSTAEGRPAIALGTDAPGLAAAAIAEAGARLETADVVLAPALDGGYVLLGLHACDPALFSDIAWGSEQVLATTRARADALGWTRAELALQWDLDRPDDLARLADLGPTLRAFTPRHSTAPAR
jgi:rSAM/selenodomain-associated transferase 1